MSFRLPKVGPFFFKTLDNRYLIKTIPPIEALTLLKKLPDYFKYIVEHPNTLLLRILGFYRIEKRGQIIFFLVFENVFYGQYSITEQYDMKGSTVGRSTNSSERLSDSAMKDLDFLKWRKNLSLSTDVRSSLLQQIEEDARWLDGHRLLDYSLLIGICNAPDPLLENNDNFNDISIFRKMGGGLKVGKEIVYIGIIDILTKFTMKKKAEHYIIGALSDRNQISAIPPDKYRLRFVEFFRNIFVKQDL